MTSEHLLIKNWGNNIYLYNITVEEKRWMFYAKNQISYSLASNTYSVLTFYWLYAKVFTHKTALTECFRVQSFTFDYNCFYFKCYQFNNKRDELTKLAIDWNWKRCGDSFASIRYCWSFWKEINHKLCRMWITKLKWVYISKTHFQ